MATYDLDDVRAAARNLNIEYRGRKVQRDTANLGYEHTDVADCLAKLTAADFRKTHLYQGCPPDDEYICLYKKLSSMDEEKDQIYIKFCLINGSLSIDLASFHLPQY